VPIALWAAVLAKNLRGILVSFGFSPVMAGFHPVLPAVVRGRPHHSRSFSFPADCKSSSSQMLQVFDVEEVSRAVE